MEDCIESWSFSSTNRAPGLDETISFNLFEKYNQLHSENVRNVASIEFWKKLCNLHEQTINELNSQLQDAYNQIRLIKRQVDTCSNTSSKMSKNDQTITEQIEYTRSSNTLEIFNRNVCNYYTITSSLDDSVSEPNFYMFNSERLRYF